MEIPKRYGNPNGDPEMLDTTPIEMPLGAMQPTPIHELIARMVRQAVAEETDEDPESFNEANDFEEEDDTLLDMSPYTLMDQEPDQWDGIMEFDPPEPTPPPEPKPNGDPPNPNAEETITP